MNFKTKRIIYSLIFALPLLVFFILAFTGTIHRYDPSGLSNIGGFINSFFAGTVAVICGMIIAKLMRKSVQNDQISEMFRDILVIGFMLTVSITLTVLIADSLSGNILLGLA